MLTAEPATTGLDAWVARGQEAATLDAAARSKARTRRFDTIAVHGLYDHLAAAANQGSIIEPAYWGYTRIASPTIHYLG